MNDATRPLTPSDSPDTLPTTSVPEKTSPSSVPDATPLNQPTPSDTALPPQPAKTPPPVLQPGPELDAGLEEEISAALGDMSLMDMIDDIAPPAAEAKAGLNTPGEATGGLRTGRIIRIDGGDIFVDLGGKDQGILPRTEIEDTDVVEVGHTIDVCVVGEEDRDGLLILSKKSADQQILRRNLKPGVLVEARVIGTNKGGLEMDIKGLRAFMPAGQIDLMHIENLDSLIGQRYECEVIQVERGDQNVVLSRRNLLLREREVQKQQTWNELNVGETRHGIVRNIMDYGAFVDIGGVDGLLHIREISWARLKHPSEVLSAGQGIDVVIIDLDREKQRISLSLRRAGADPWTLVEQNYPIGLRCQAQIVNLMNFGAFAQLEPGVEGLIPISQMTWAGRIRHPGDVVQVGQMVEVEIMDIDIAKKRISLSMKRLEENPWSNIADRYQPDHNYTGQVARLTDFGAFITLEPGVDGLVHISELSDKHVNRTSDVLREGQNVEVRVLSVDPQNRRISLSIKAMLLEQAKDTSGMESASAEMPGPTEPIAPPANKPSTKRSKSRRGGLDWSW